MLKPVFFPALLLMGLLAPATAIADTHLVTTTVDAVDAGDGVTSLREAVILANQDTSGHPVIRFDLPGTEPTLPLTAPLPIQQTLSLEGPTDTQITIALSEASEGPLLELAGSASGSTFSQLVFQGHAGADFLGAVGDVTVENSRIERFRQTFFLGSGVQLTVRNSLLSDNARILSAMDSNLFASTGLTGASLTLEDSLLRDNGAVARIENHTLATPPFALTLDHSRITGQTGGSSFTLRGAITLDLTGCTLDANQPDTLIAADRGDYGSIPRVTLVNSTISDNQWTDFRPLVRVLGDGLVVRHSTLAGNTTVNNQPLISADDARVTHSILTTNPGVSHDLEGAGAVRYSLVDSTVADYTVEAPVTGNAELAPLAFSDSLTGTLAPQHNSPVVGAGDPGLSAGSGDTPTTDQSGSDRIINGVIDIGAVEFNRAPLINVPALQAAFHGEDFELEITGLAMDLGYTSTVWSGLTMTMVGITFAEEDSSELYLIDRGAYEETITIAGHLSVAPSTPVASAMTVAESFDLDFYVYDPDQGDQVSDIALVSADAGVSLDSSTNALSGSREAFTAEPVVLALTDEHGLTGIRSVKFTEPAPPTETAEEKDGGGAGFGLLLLTLLGRLRRHS